MRKTIDIGLAFTVIVPAILLFWPFAMWGAATAVVLRVGPSFAAQVLLFRVRKGSVIKVLPVLLTAVFAVWGTYLYFTSPHWSNASFWGGLVADYVSPFLSCLTALFVCTLVEKK